MIQSVSKSYRCEERRTSAGQGLLTPGAQATSTAVFSTNYEDSDIFNYVRNTFGTMARW